MYSILDKLSVTKYEYLENYGFQGDIYIDSRDVKYGGIFFALKGKNYDGRIFIEEAIKNGAKIIFYDDDRFDALSKYKNYNEVEFFPIKNLSKYVGIISSFLLDNHANMIPIIGITGTNGKTSISYWLAQAIFLLGKKSAYIGTNGNAIYGEEVLTTKNTTPDAINLQKLIKFFKKEDVQAISMEVSSIGIEESRVNGVDFKIAVFTNLTQDHLDYHINLEDYFQSKKKLFYWYGLEYAIINIDDKYGLKLYLELKKNCPNLKIITYGFSKSAQIQIINTVSNLEDSLITIKTLFGTIEVKTILLGKYNALNIAACIGTLLSLDFTLEDIAKVFKFIKPAKGRLDPIKFKNRPLVIIDYAHTPDALENVLNTLNEIKINDSKIWCVFGCGGNRDQSKRAIMGKVAKIFADYVVITSDNPRDEDPMSIIKDIMSQITDDSNMYINTSRTDAIKYALSNAKDNDIILIAGKGHETYQEIKSKKIYFSDFDVVNNFFYI